MTILLTLHIDTNIFISFVNSLQVFPYFYVQQFFVWVWLTEFDWCNQQQQHENKKTKKQQFSYVNLFTIIVNFIDTRERQTMSSVFYVG